MEIVQSSEISVKDLKDRSNELGFNEKYYYVNYDLANLNFL
jgi:hypothetical protein